MTLSERIKKMRKELDLTQQEFADKLGVKRGTVATYERGRSDPSDAAVVLICKTFNVNETWLRNGEGEMFNKTLDSVVDQLATEFGLDGFLQSVVSEYLKLDKRQRNTVQHFIFNIVSEIPPDLIPAPAEQAADRGAPPGYSSLEELEAEARAEAEEYYREILEEKKRAASGSASSGSDTSGTA